MNAAMGMPMWERPQAAVQWRLLLYALVATLLIFAGLPLAEVLKSARTLESPARVVETVLPPPPPPPRALPAPMAPALPRILPQYTEPRAAVKVPIAEKSLHLPLIARPLAGDVAVAFPVAAEGSLALAMDGVFDVAEADSPPHPIVRMPPLYPPRARMRQIEGEVQVEFVVSAEGRVRDAVVVHANPPDIFEQSALQAVQHWRFKPGLIDGQPVAIRVRQKLTFTLEE